MIESLCDSCRRTFARQARCRCVAAVNKALGGYTATKENTPQRQSASTSKIGNVAAWRAEFIEKMLTAGDRFMGHDARKIFGTLQ